MKNFFALAESKNFANSFFLERTPEKISKGDFRAISQNINSVTFKQRL